jgi:hypothetical protein
MYVSQFAKTDGGFGVLPLGMNDYLFGLESRDRFFGSLIGAHHREALVSEVPLKLGSLNSISPPGPNHGAGGPLWLPQTRLDRTDRG